MLKEMWCLSGGVLMLDPLFILMLGLVILIASRINKKYRSQDKAKNLRLQGLMTAGIAIVYMLISDLYLNLVTPPDIVFVGILILLGIIMFVVSYRIKK